MQTNGLVKSQKITVQQWVRDCDISQQVQSYIFWH